MPIGKLSGVCKNIWYFLCRYCILLSSLEGFFIFSMRIPHLRRRRGAYCFVHVGQTVSRYLCQSIRRPPLFLLNTAYRLQTSRVIILALFHTASNFRGWLFWPYSILCLFCIGSVELRLQQPLVRKPFQPNNLKLIL